MDLDDTFKPELKKLLSIYHKMFEGYLVYANKPPNWGGITIGPRELIARIGGWRDLQFNEDWDLWARAAKIGKFKVLNYELRESIRVSDAKIQGAYGRLKYRYIKYRELYRLGRKVFAENERITIPQKIIAYLAYITSLLYPSFHDPFNESFDPWNKKYMERLL